MMEINRNNYEAYFIDYLEGNLDERLIDGFITFIQANPDLKEELELFEPVSAMPEKVSYNKKNILYKEKFDSEEEFNAAAVARMEGYITEEEKAAFEDYLNTHPEKKTEEALFYQTVLKAETLVTFNKKHKLYRKSPVKVLLMWSGSVAAVLILGLLVLKLFPTKTEHISPTQRVAAVNEIVTKEEKTETEVLPQFAENNTKETKIESAPVQEKTLEFTRTKNKVETKNPQATEELMAQTRTAIEVPTEMNSITASIDIQKTEASLGVMYLYYPELPENYDEKLLVDVVKEKTGFSFRKISKAGLKLASNISNERFSYETTPDGKVKEYKYDSRLFAFSIPAKKTKPE